MKSNIRFLSGVEECIILDILSILSVSQIQFMIVVPRNLGKTAHFACVQSVEFLSVYLSRQCVSCLCKSNSV